ncbi:glycosyltransferase family 2 protein [Pedobacter sp. PWIIR3]
MIESTMLQALILTKNEEPNLNRVLERLKWLNKVLIIDSFSTDDTLAIAASYSNVVVVQRAFDSFASQCNYGLSLIDSQWVLSLDADYVLTDEFIEETKQIIKSNDKVAYAVKFKFLVFGKPLLRDNTTPRTVLFVKKFGSYFNDGHAHRLNVDGAIGKYKSHILHDDRKSLSRWLSNQDGYAIKECDKILDSELENLNISSRIRKTKIIAPFLVFFYSLFIKGLIFNGWRGWHYTLQRTLVEILFAIRLIEEENLKKDIES